MCVVDLLDGLVDVLRCPAKFVQDEGRRLVELHGAGQREDHVFRTNGVSGGEDGFAGQGEGQALAVGAGFPGGCERRLYFGPSLRSDSMRRW
jgi:hypothetical protein